MSDERERLRRERRGRFGRDLHERAKAHRFFRRVQSDFRYGTTCNLCWATNWSAVRSLQAVAEPGMSEDELTLAAYRHLMAQGGPWNGGQPGRQM